MMKRVWFSIRVGSALLLIVIFFLALGIAVLGNVGTAQAVPPQQDTPEVTPGPRRAEDITSPEYQSCGECHLDRHAAWEDGVHATAFEGQAFQEVWGEQDNNPECLNCHTTDYRPATNEFLVENVRCEACHGLTPENHPPEPFELRTDAEICGDCHTDTFEEWRHSLHASVAQFSYLDEDMEAIGCATCHEPHGQNIRFETVEGLCMNCHEDMPEHTLPYEGTFIHVTHNEIDFENVNIDCSSCHMYNQNIDAVHERPDHSMQVGTVACTDCHKEIALQGDSPVFTDIDSRFAEERDALQTQVQELQTELEAAEEAQQESSGIDYVQLTQGLIVGLGVGITVVWILLRRENGNRKEASGGESSS